MYEAGPSKYNFLNGWFLAVWLVGHRAPRCSWVTAHCLVTTMDLFIHPQSPTYTLTPSFTTWSLMRALKRGDRINNPFIHHPVYRFEDSSSCNLAMPTCIVTFSGHLETDCVTEYFKVDLGTSSASITRRIVFCNPPTPQRALSGQGIECPTTCCHSRKAT